MKRTSGRIGIGMVLASMLVGACLTERERGDAPASIARPEAALPDTHSANDVVLAVRSHLERAFGVKNVQLSTPMAPLNVRHPFDAVGSTEAPVVEFLGMNGGTGNVGEKAAEVTLPSRADGAFRLLDQSSGLSIDVGLVGANASAREEANGYVVYRSGYINGAHIVHRVTSRGTEDYVFFPEASPEKPELRNEIALGEKVAGLRLVEKTVEAVDAGGVPRLRMAPPYAVDGDGRRLELNVAIEGCAYDTNLKMPWERPTVAPGSRHCTVRLSWDAQAKAPLVVDPEWILTTNMVKSRMNATTTLLPDGRVLVAGGDLGTPGAGSVLASAEVYNPKMNIWMPTGAMSQPRTDHQVIALTDFAVAMGGTDSLLIDKYSYVNNTWSQDPNVPMMKQRSKFAAVMVPGKFILATGGISTGGAPTNTAEYLLLTPQDPAWVLTPSPMTTTRFGHSATVLEGGKVLVVGGFGPNGPMATAEVYFHNMPPVWYAIGSMMHPHANHAALKLSDGRVIVAGGDGSTAMMMPSPTSNVEMFGGIMAPTWQSVKSMSNARMLFGAALIPGTDQFVAMGGASNAMGNIGPSKSAEKYLPDTDEWVALTDMHFARSNFTAVALHDGRILAPGGTIGPVGATGTADLLSCTTDDDCEMGTYCAVDQTCKTSKANGEQCDLAGPDKLGKDCKEANCRVCASENCTDGVCCDMPCKGQCEACNGSVVGSKPGQCVPVFGPPETMTIEMRQACADDGLCGGACNGVRVDGCTYPKGNACNATCTADSNKFESFACDGKGACSTVVFSQPCSPYVCDVDKQQCTTGCTPEMNGMPQTGCNDNTSVCNTDGQCISRPTKCIDDKTMELPDGSMQSCLPYRCVNAACMNVCDTAYDCLPVLDTSKVPPEPVTYACDENRKCVPANGGVTSGESSGCSTAPANESSRFGWLAALVMAGVVAARRNRVRA
jgi:MYXO-CTERM domain-containing protein